MMDLVMVYNKNQSAKIAHKFFMVGKTLLADGGPRIIQDMHIKEGYILVISTGRKLGLVAKHVIATQVLPLQINWKEPREVGRKCELRK